MIIRWVAALTVSILSVLPAGSTRREPDSRGDDHTIAPFALIEKAKSERSAGNFEQAAKLFREARKLFDASNEQRGKASCLMNLGLTSWDLGEIRESSRYFSEAATLFRSQHDVLSENLCRKGMEVIQFYNLGKEYGSQNRNDKSLECFDKAIDLGRHTGIQSFELKCLRLESLTYWQLGDVESFLGCNTHALEIARKINHRKEIGRCLNNVGAYYEKTGDYSNALRNFEMALPILQSERDSFTEASCINNIGVIYRNVGELDKALSEMAHALRIDEKLGDLELIVEDYGNLGATFLRRGWINESKQDVEIALKKLSTCIDLLKSLPDKKLEFSVLNNIGFAYCLIQEYDRALEILEKELTKVNGNQKSEEACHLLNNIATAYLRKGNIEKAVHYYTRSAAVCGQNKYLEILWEAYFGLGCCYEAEKDLPTALEYFTKSIEAMEHIRRRITLDTFKISFARSKFAVYQRALDILYSFYTASPTPARLENIFRMVERAKARAFLEGLIEANVGDPSGINPEMIGREQKLSREISILNLKAGKLGVGTAERDEHLKELEKKEDEYMRLISSVKTERRGINWPLPFRVLSISDVRTALLDERTALLEYSVGDNRSYLLLITRHDARLYTLAGEEGLENSLRGYLKSLSSKPSGPFNGVLAAERIGRELVSPLGSDLPQSIDTLIIIPDGVLDYLPFEALRVNEGGRESYLVEKYRISYCPSTAALYFLKQKPREGKQGKTLLAFGEPTYGKPAHPEHWSEPNSPGILGGSHPGQEVSLSPLPFSKKEVLGISGLFSAHQTDVFLGNQANETVLKNMPLDTYQIIHFACHGALDDKLPFRSALVLSQGTGLDDDGLLQVREIYNLKMDADLVVLSACQTGNGTLEKAEGLVGLTRSFFHAGANSILSTIWSINDRTTAFLMEKFYSCLAKGQDKSNALREAKLSLLKSRHSHPFYWAGFILNGNPAPIQIDSRKARGMN